MNVLRAAIGILGLALLGLAIWAAFALQDLHGSFLHQFGVVATLPWGIATAGAMIAGYLLLAAVIFLTERSGIVAALWCAPAIAATALFAIATGMAAPARLADVLVWLTPGFLVGIISAAIWLLVRLPRLAKQLSRPEWPT
ncbi:MAG: hypothetical protein ACREH4_12880 [Vitreimonas sp.]